MQSQVYPSILGMVSTGSPTAMQAANSLEDSLNVVSPQQGIMQTRHGHGVFGPIDGAVAYKQWDKEPSVSQQDIKSIYSWKPVLAGYKVDRTLAYGTYNPASGFCDAIVVLEGASSDAISMLGWISNDGYTNGFYNEYNPSSRSDLLRYTVRNITTSIPNTQDERYTLFAGTPNSLFDSCISIPEYRFIDKGQIRYVQDDSNRWFRSYQPKDFDSTYNTGTSPARCWRHVATPEIKMSEAALQIPKDGSGWLAEGYAVDVFCVIKVVEEDGTEYYGKRSAIVTCKNFTSGLAIPIITPLLVDEHFNDLDIETSVIEVYRTKQYKWYGSTPDVNPSAFYLCYSETLKSCVLSTSPTLVPKYGYIAGSWSSNGTNCTTSVTDPNFLILTGSSSSSQSAIFGFHKTDSITASNVVADITIGRVAGTATSTDIEQYNWAPAWKLLGTNVKHVSLFKSTFDSNLESFLVTITGAASSPITSIYIKKISFYRGLILTLGDESIFLESPTEFDTFRFPWCAGHIRTNERVIGYNSVLPSSGSTSMVKINTATPTMSGTLLYGGYPIYNDWNALLTSPTDKTVKGDLWRGGSESFSPSIRSCVSQISDSISVGYEIYGAAEKVQQRITFIQYDPTAKTLTIKYDTSSSIASILETGVIVVRGYLASATVYEGTPLDLLDILTYSSYTKTFSGISWTVVLANALSIGSLSYNSPATISSSGVFVSFLTSSGFSNLPVWVDDQLIIGERVNIIKVTTPYCDYIKSSLEPHAVTTGAATVVGTAKTGWTYGGTAGYAPLISDLPLQLIQYQPITLSGVMSESLRRFAREAGWYWSRNDPLAISNTVWDYSTDLGNSLSLSGGNANGPYFDKETVVGSTGTIDLTPTSNHIPNAVIFSLPYEVTKAVDLFNCLRIGDSNKPITNIVDFNGVLYVFKEEEGIYRLQVDEANPNGSPNLLIDNTHWMISNKSVQLIMDGLYFLSNRGISVLNSAEEIQDISDPIQQTIADYIQQVGRDTTLGSTVQERWSKICAYGNEARRLYSIHFPRVGDTAKGITVVYSGNTGQWTKSDQRFEAAWNSKDITYTIEPINTVTGGMYTSTRTGTVFRKDNGTINMYDVLDQHDGTKACTFSAYSAVTGILSVTDSVVTTDGTSLANFYAANRDKYFYAKRNDGLWYKATPTFLGSTLSLQLTNTPYPATFTLSSGSNIAVSITSSLTFNKFFMSGFSKARFSEGSIGVKGSNTGVSIKFKSYENSTWSTGYDTFRSAEIFRMWVPREACMGRWLKMKVEHSQPFEYFSPYSLSYFYAPFAKEQKSTRNMERT